MKDLVLSACSALGIMDRTMLMRQYKTTKRRLPKLVHLSFHWTCLGIVIFLFGVNIGYKITMHIRDFTLLRKIPEWHGWEGKGRVGGAGMKMICQKLIFLPQCKT